MKSCNGIISLSIPGRPGECSLDGYVNFAQPQCIAINNNIHNDHDGLANENSSVIDNTQQISMSLEEFMKWDKLTMYGARACDTVKLNKILSIMKSDDGDGINVSGIRALFTESLPSIVITKSALNKYFVKIDSVINWKPNKSKTANYATAPAMLVESNHRLTALRLIDCLRNTHDHDIFLKLTPLCIRVFVVPDEYEEEFSESIVYADNSSGQRAPWSIVQFKVCAMLDKELTERHARESTSFMDKIAACQTLYQHFPHFDKFKHATDAHLLEPSSAMEAAFECSRFSDDLLNRIKKLFSPEWMSSVVLYREAPDIINRVYIKNPEVLDRFIDGVITSEAIRSGRLRNMISGILSLEVSPIERSTTKNAQFKSSGNAKQREKSKISAIMDGMIHARCTGNVTVKAEGASEIARLRSCVSGAVDTSLSMNKRNIADLSRFVALFKKNADVIAHLEWAKCFVQNGGIVLTMDMTDEVKSGVFDSNDGDGVVEKIRMRAFIFYMNRSNLPSHVCGIYAKESVYNTIEPMIHETPKSFKCVLENYGIDTDQVMVVNFIDKLL